MGMRDLFGQLCLPTLRPGSVWLVGAGPGDPGLLTVHAVSALQQADIILHDALVSEDILSLASANARTEAAGKRGYSTSIPQAHITRRLIELAQKGLRVVRLKGGDPFVFARGTEEVLGLIQRGIPVSVVPGITAGIAALTSAAIPLTTRKTNSAVILAAGHYASEGCGGMDWEHLARAHQPIVLYMALANIGAIAKRLMNAGLSPQTPVSLISNATLATQQVLESRLDCAEADAKAVDMKAPAVIAIGSNVTWRKELVRGIVPLFASVPLRRPHQRSAGKDK
jgi:uroporphyrin-III C-methyltransferase